VHESPHGYLSDSSRESQRVGPNQVREWTPTVRRPGRRFEPILEKELDADLRLLAQKLPGAKLGVDVLAEFAASNGVADLVAVTRAEQQVRLIASRREVFLSTLADADVAAACRDVGGTSLSQILERTGYSEKLVRRSIRQLLDTGLLMASKKGFVRADSLFPVGRMYAFEAKVSDWRAALAQSVRYSAWADAVAIVLLKQPADLAVARESATRLSVGLAIGPRWVVRPKLGQPQRGPRLLASELFVRSVIEPRN